LENDARKSAAGATIKGEASLTPTSRKEIVVRLTLRTLLAYLDDTLEPAETKLIGQKVAESDPAQELIARIKQVTRRRRLTTPPATGPNSFEPNTVAEYLDNTLSPEQVAEVEKACLESDVHLAEIAAAHQILTLVLGQPILVPPTAKQRMYLLVHGRRPARARATAAATPNGAAGLDPDSRAEEDETLLLGLPFYRRHAAMRWLLPLAGVLLLAALGLAVWHRLPSFTSNSGNQVAINDRNTPPTQPVTQETKKEDTSKDQGTPTGTPTGTNNGGGSGDGGSSGSGTNDGGSGSGFTSPLPKPVKRPEKPSEDRRAVVKVGSGVAPGVLLKRDATSGAWKSLKRGEQVSSRDLLVSLPGVKSDLRVDNGPTLTLWGSTYEYLSPFLESAVVLYAPPEGFDADFALDRGAVLITNQEKNAQVRIRFFRETWDVTLEAPETEVGVAFLGRHIAPYGSGEPPRVDGFLVVRKGKASLRTSHFDEPLPLAPYQEGRRVVPTVVFWDSQGKGPQPPMYAVDPRVQQQISVFDPPGRADLPDDLKREADRAKTALDGLGAKLSSPDPIEATLTAVIEKEPATSQEAALRARLAVRYLGALDAVTDLVNILDSSDRSPDLRFEAIRTLRHWIGRNAGQEAILYDPQTRSGVLTKGGNFSTVSSPSTPPEAAVFMELLHTPTQQQLNSPPFWSYLIENLKHDRLAIRELAHFHLRRQVPEAAMIAYDPNGSAEARKKGYDEWKKLIPEGKLPPTRP